MARSNRRGGGMPRAVNTGNQEPAQRPRTGGQQIPNGQRPVNVNRRPPEKKKSKAPLIIVIIILLALIVGGMFVYISSQNAKMQAEQARIAQEQKQKEEQAKKDQDLSSGGDITPTGFPADVKSIKSLKGEESPLDQIQINPDPKVVADNVNFVKHRKQLGDGMIYNYLNAQYQGKNYIIQIDQRVYNQLPDQGIVGVIIQKSTDNNNHEFITDMKAEPNLQKLYEEYNEMLQKNAKAIQEKAKDAANKAVMDKADPNKPTPKDPTTQN